MTLRSISDNGFFEFLRRGAGKYLAVAMLGIALLTLCGGFGLSDVSEQSEEEGIAEICSLVEGVGGCRVMISRDGDGVTAVTVLCEGAEDVEVRARLTDMLSAFYGIGTNRITILKIEDKKL